MYIIKTKILEKITAELDPSVFLIKSYSHVSCYGLAITLDRMENFKGLLYREGEHLIDLLYLQVGSLESD